MAELSPTARACGLPAHDAPRRALTCRARHTYMVHTATAYGTHGAHRHLCPHTLLFAFDCFCPAAAASASRLAPAPRCTACTCVAAARRSCISLRVDRPRCTCTARGQRKAAEGCERSTEGSERQRKANGRQRRTACTRDAAASACCQNSSGSTGGGGCRATGLAGSVRPSAAGLLANAACADGMYTVFSSLAQ